MLMDRERMANEDLSRLIMNHGRQERNNSQPVLQNINNVEPQRPLFQRHDSAINRTGTPSVQLVTS